MPELDTITAKLTADVSSFTSGLASANQSVEQFKTATQTATSGTKTFYEGVQQAGEFASGSERGMRRMEFAMGALAAETSGANRAVGMFAEGVLLFGAGSVTTLSVLAGIGALAGALKLLGSESESDIKHVEALEKALDKLGLHGKQMAAELQLGLLEARKTMLETMGGKAGAYAQLGEDVRVLFGGEPIDAQIATIKTQIAEASRKFSNEENKRKKKEADEENDAMLADRAAWHKGMTELERAFGKEEREIRRMHEHDRREIAKAEEKEAEEAAKKVAEAAKRATAEMEEIGVHAMKSFVDGIMAGHVQFGKILENAFFAFVERSVKLPVLGALGIASPSAFGMQVGAMVAEGVAIGAGSKDVGPMGMNLNLNVTKGGVLSPFDMARDADWQRAWRETALVAQAQGFTVPVR